MNTINRPVNEKNEPVSDKNGPVNAVHGSKNDKNGSINPVHDPADNIHGQINTVIRRSNKSELPVFVMFQEKIDKNRSVTIEMSEVETEYTKAKRNHTTPLRA